MSGGGTTLEYTPTWVVALVCTVIVFISLAVERILHFLGKVCFNSTPFFFSLSYIDFYVFYVLMKCVSMLTLCFSVFEEKESETSV